MNANTDALVLAICKQDVAKVDAALARGASASATDQGFTMLWLAAGRPNARIVERLLAAGARIDACSPTGQTALGVAASNGRRAVVVALLAAGADPNLARDHEDPPLHHAVRARQLVITRLLLAAGGLDRKNFYDRTARELASPAIAKLFTASRSPSRSSSAPRGRGAPARRRRAGSAGRSRS